MRVLRKKQRNKWVFMQKKNEINNVILY
jgi:hypothetical protein